MEKITWGEGSMEKATASDGSEDNMGEGPMEKETMSNGFMEKSKCR